MTGTCLGSFSIHICRLLQLCDEEYDGSSPLAAPKLEPKDHSLQVGDNNIFQEPKDQKLCLLCMIGLFHLKQEDFEHQAGNRQEWNWLGRC
ncbi:Transcription factor VOZ1-like protein [Quillaja saponaria]|uniref:Transcription factor VOZ1-like protein n=1 Tax=Quillaja saponaria TaxID=32244 RepID=A0AAD7LT07_QUISA|nr:Transcription factor VOZ1-like protein [Quillaja saponaria]